LVECVRALEPYPQIVAVGINCTAPRHIEPLLNSIRHSTKKYLIVYPNRGEEWDAQQKQWVSHTEEKVPNFETLAPLWKQAGATLIGGCCRCTFKDIKTIATVLQNTLTRR